MTFPQIKAPKLSNRKVRFATCDLRKILGVDGDGFGSGKHEWRIGFFFDGDDVWEPESWLPSLNDLRVIPGWPWLPMICGASIAMAICLIGKLGLKR